MLRRFGFGKKWCGWIWECISTASFSVLVNESPARLFRSTRGLRQGDASPFLYTMVEEASSALLLKEKECSLVGGFKVVRGDMAIPIFNLLMTLSCFHHQRLRKL